MENSKRKTPPFIPQEQRDGAEVQTPQGCANPKAFFGLRCGHPSYRKFKKPYEPKAAHLADYFPQFRSMAVPSANVAAKEGSIIALAMTLRRTSSPRRYRA